MTAMAEPSTNISRLRPARRSAFQELDIDTIIPRSVLEQRTSSYSESDPDDSNFSPSDDSPTSQSSADSFDNQPSLFSTTLILPRLLILAFTLLLTISLLYEAPLLAKAGPSILGAKARVIKRSSLQRTSIIGGQLLAPRADTDTGVCSRWSQQSALVNGTIYVYGGRATTKENQQDNTWVNDFFTIDVTKSWDISSPAVKGLPQPSGPPAVALGSLWNSHDTLYLYGGEFSDTPFTTPPDFSLWSYDIKSASWSEHENPQTSAGNNSDDENQPVQRAAEGAGISVPELGRGWYFAGHLDEHTTPGWSYQIYRTYLKSLIEYTFPGHPNDGVKSLSGGKTAGQDGVWRNITQGGIQDTAQFPLRADSALVYVPGYGAQGILVSLGGGTNVSFVSHVGYQDV